jgi:hypothetical protein
MERGISVDAEQIRAGIMELMQEAEGALSVESIAVKLDIENNRASYGCLVLLSERKIRRIGGVDEGIYYEISR